MMTLGLVLFAATLFIIGGMILTAQQFVNNPEGNYANCCRLILNIFTCIGKMVYNLYHCRLSEIPQVVCYMDDEDEIDEEELEKMKPRPGIERALEMEHKKAMQSMEVEMQALKNPKKKFMTFSW